MRRLIWLPVVALLALAVWLWGFGGADWVSLNAARGQREVQEALAGALRALKRGEPGAIWALWGLCFAYGFFHAAGPGHGKLVIGGYGLGQRVPMLRLSGLALASSLGQAVTAVALVYLALGVLGWSREQVQGISDGAFEALSYAMIAGIGLWLLWRGLRKLLRQTRHDHHHDPHHHHDHDHHHAHDGAICETCGHAHGPTIEEAANVHSLRDAIVLVGAVAIRPCTGALFLLILTWRLGIGWAGITGAFIMALGTASVTIAVAIAAVVFRESSLMQAGNGQGARRLAALIEVAAGALVLIVATQMLMRVL